MQANKTADNQYLIPLMDGIIENIDIADGILLTTSEFVSQEDIEMTTTHDDLSLFQISFALMAIWSGLTSITRLFINFKLRHSRAKYAMEHLRSAEVE